MKKEFLDFLYDKRSKLQIKIDNLVNSSKNPIHVCCKDMESQKYDSSLDEVRLHIQSINLIISEYLLIHKI